MSETLYERIMNEKDTEKPIAAYAGDLQEIITHIEGKTKTVSEVMANHIDRLVSSRDAWKKLAEDMFGTIGIHTVWDSEQTEIECMHCHQKAEIVGHITHSPDCPIEQLRELQKETK